MGMPLGSLLLEEGNILTRMEKAWSSASFLTQRRRVVLLSVSPTNKTEKDILVIKTYPVNLFKSGVVSEFRQLTRDVSVLFSVPCKVNLVLFFSLNFFLWGKITDSYALQQAIQKGPRFVCPASSVTSSYKMGLTHQNWDTDLDVIHQHVLCFYNQLTWVILVTVT